MIDARYPWYSDTGVPMVGSEGAGAETGVRPLVVMKVESESSTAIR